jgi:ABC-type histidine transport system ATPase subunit
MNIKLDVGQKPILTGASHDLHKHNLEIGMMLAGNLSNQDAAFAIGIGLRRDGVAFMASTNQLDPAQVREVLRVLLDSMDARDKKPNIITA